MQACPAEENEAYAAWTDGFCAGGGAVLEGACPEDKGALAGFYQSHCFATLPLDALTGFAGCV